MILVIKQLLILTFAFSPLELEKHDFLLGSVIDAVVSQVMFALRDRGVQLIRDIPEEVKTLTVYGDQTRVQQVLTNFLLNMVHHSPSPNGWVEIQVRPTLKQIFDGMTDVHIEFRYVALPSRFIKIWSLSILLLLVLGLIP